MGTIISILSGSGQWLLKIFLGGLFNKVITQAEDEAKHKVDASIIHAGTTNDSADVSIKIVKDQSDVKDHYNNKPVNPTDPFDNSDWNEGDKK